MVYTTNIPQATDLISNSQAQILANFQFLGDTTGNVTPGFYKLPNGLIIQWGSILVNSVGNKQQSYAVAFTTQVFSLTFSLAFTSGADSLAFGTAVCVDNNGALSLSTAKFRNASAPPVGDNPTLYWVAIGV